MNQESNPKSSTFFLLSKGKTIFVATIAGLLFLIYMWRAPLSSILIEFGNAQYSAENNALGMASYRLALILNSKLKAIANQCQSANAQQQFEQAISYCSETIEIEPNYVSAYFSRGFAYIQQGQSDLAISDCNKALELASKYWSAYYCLGLAYSTFENSDMAIESLNKAIELNPNIQVAYFTRGLVYDAHGNTNLAIADYTKTIEIDPNYSKAYGYRGVIYTTQKNYELAFLDLNKAIEINPDYADFYTWRGNAFADTKEFNQAIADYQKALTLSNNLMVEKSYTFCVQGITYTKTGDFELAIASLEQGIKQDPANEWCKMALENARQGIPTP